VHSKPVVVGFVVVDGVDDGVDCVEVVGLRFLVVAETTIVVVDCVVEVVVGVVVCVVVVGVVVVGVVVGVVGNGVGGAGVYGPVNMYILVCLFLHKLH